MEAQRALGFCPARGARLLALLVVLLAAAAGVSAQFVAPPAAEGDAAFADAAATDAPAEEWSLILPADEAASFFAPDQAPPAAPTIDWGQGPEFPTDDLAPLLGPGPEPAGGGATGALTESELAEVALPESVPSADAPEPPKPPGERIGRMISLLKPPPDFTMPILTAEQLAMVPKLQKLRQGAATVSAQRDVGPLDAGRMACGIAFLNDHFTKHWVGLSLPLFRTGELCGACVRMFCVDSVCENPLLNNTLFMIVDSCQECGPNDLVASAPGLTNLAGGVSVDLNPKFQVAWTFASCAPLIQGGIRMWPSDRTAPEFLGLQFSNLKALLGGVSINGIAMQRTEYGYFTIDTPGKPIPLRPPYQLVLESAAGERIGARIVSLRPQDLGVNFRG